jgi:hypothetical protein
MIVASTVSVGAFEMVSAGLVDVSAISPVEELASAVCVMGISGVEDTGDVEQDTSKLMPSKNRYRNNDFFKILII